MTFGRTYREHCVGVQANSMGRGQWTRWGGGACEGWSLEIGMAFHGSVVRRDRSGEPPTWIASINSTALGEFLQRETAHRVEELVETSMSLVQTIMCGRVRLSASCRRCGRSWHWLRALPVDGTCGGISTRRCVPAETRQARCSARAVFDLNPGRHSLPRCSRCRTMVGIPPSN